jgi:flagellin
MGIRISPGLDLLAGQRQVSQTAQRLQRGFEGLASGLRINRAADDAAGLAIAERLRADVRQFSTEIDTLQQGINLVSTAEGGLSSQQDGVARLRDLALQASNGTLNDDQRAALNEEAQQILAGIQETAENTEFNERAVLDGSASAIELGTEGGAQVNVEESTVDSLGLTGFDISTQAGAQAAIGAADNASNQISQNRAGIGAQQNRFESAIAVREVGRENAIASESAIRDLDISRAVIEQTRNELLLNAGIGAIAQGNIVPQTALRLLGG